MSLDEPKDRRHVPSLSRSSTGPLVPSFKRESSTVSLAEIPPVRPGEGKLKRYSSREIDLNAMSQATQAKLKRKAAVQEELRGAIATLKKPNRRIAVKELVESFERRGAGQATNSRSECIELTV